MVDFGTCPQTHHNLPLIHWIRDISGECIYGNLEALSWASQYISIGVWVFAGTYQSYQLYKSKDVNGFSEGFLFCWIVGAFLNVLGCVCTGQMPFQVVLAFYFLFSDSFLYFQYKYYEARPWLAQEQVLIHEREHLLAKEEDHDNDSDNDSYGSYYNSSSNERQHRGSISKDSIINTSSSSTPASKGYSTFTPGVVLGLAYGSSTTSGAPIPEDVTTSTFKSATEQLITFTTTSTHSDSQLLTFITALQLIVGNTASWASNTLYAVSRFPQIKRNFERKSCDGVSPALFLATLFGNISYCITIFCAWRSITDPREASDFFMTEVPFIAGAVATTLADIVIFAQFYIYKDSHDPEHLIEAAIAEVCAENMTIIEAAPVDSEDDEDEGKIGGSYTNSGSSKGGSLKFGDAGVASTYYSKH